MDIEHKISVGAQSLRNRLWSARPTATRPAETQLRAAFAQYGLRVDKIGITASMDRSGGYILTASGWHEDGIPFSLATQPFIGDVIARGKQAAADIVAAHIGGPAPDPDSLTSAPVVTTSALQAPAAAVDVTTSALQQPTPTQPPLPAFLQPQARKPMATPTATHKAKSFADRLKAVTTKIDADIDTGISTLEQVEATAAQVNVKLAGVVSQRTADLAAVNDVLNQLTNGAPDDEADEPATPATPSTSDTAA